MSAAILASIGVLLDALLGPRCILCGMRVFPRDRVGHAWMDHGDEVAA